MTKTALLSLTAFLVGLFSAGAGLAAGDMKMKGAQSVGQAGMTQVSAGMLHSAESFDNLEVRDSTGQKVGEIQDIMLDMDRGIAYARISTEEPTQIDETYLVPLSALTSAHEGNFVTLNMDRGRLAASPRMEEGMTGEEFGRQVYEYYGISYPWDDLPGDVPIPREEIPAENLTYPGPREVNPPVPRLEPK